MIAEWRAAALPDLPQIEHLAGAGCDDVAVRWPLDQLLRRLGDRAELLTVGDEPVASSLAAWASEVEAFIEVPLGSISELYALEDLRGSLINREIIDEELAELPRDVRVEVERWLRNGPDAEFIRLTEPDSGRLLVRADFCDQDDEGIWASRVPQRGVARAALESEARKLDATPDDAAH